MNKPTDRAAHQTLLAYAYLKAFFGIAYRQADCAGTLDALTGISAWLVRYAAILETPVADDGKKRNKNLPERGDVFHTANTQRYSHAGNNPILLKDPDGRVTADVETGVITVDLNDHNDIRWAASVLMENRDSFTQIVASNSETGETMTFDNPKDAFAYSASIKPPMSDTEKNRWIGAGATVVGVALIVIGAKSMEKMEKQNPKSTDASAAQLLVLV